MHGRPRIQIPQARVRREWRSIVRRVLTGADVEVTCLGAVIAVVVHPALLAGHERLTKALAALLDSQSEARTKVFDEALQELGAAESAAVSARADVWKAIKAEYPDIADAIRAIGLVPEFIPEWVCRPRADLGASCAQRIADGHGGEVLELTRRAQHGFYS